jgi:glutamyl-tRNA reductase
MSLAAAAAALPQVVAANKEERARAAAEAEVLLGEEQLAFEAWRDSLETVPTIKALRGKAEGIRAGELDKAFNKLGEGLSNKQKKVSGGVGPRRGLG